MNRDTVVLTDAGQIVHETWLSLTSQFSTLVLDAFVVMPNHIHGVLAFVGAGLAPPGVGTSTASPAGYARRSSLPEVVCAFKSISTLKVNRFFGRNGVPLWQRSYHDHIVRDGEDMKNVQRYVAENPLRWLIDPRNQTGENLDRLRAALRRASRRSVLCRGGACSARRRHEQWLPSKLRPKILSSRSGLCLQIDFNFKGE